MFIDRELFLFKWYELCEIDGLFFEKPVTLVNVIQLFLKLVHPLLQLIFLFQPLFLFNLFPILHIIYHTIRVIIEEELVVRHLLCSLWASLVPIEHLLRHLLLNLVWRRHLLHLLLLLLGK